MSFLGASGRTSIAAEYANTDGDVSLTETRLQAGVPIYKSERAIWSVHARGHALSLGRTLRIADRNFEIPKDFGSAEVGFGANFPRADVSRGFSATIGTTGRRLFDAENTRALSLTYFSEWKTAPDHSWYFLVSYSNNRTVFNNIPIPGFAYGYTQKSLRLMVGAPFAFVFWMPLPYVLNATLSPFSSSADLGYIIHGPWQAMTSVAWQPRSFQNLAPDIDKQRLLFDRKEATFGVRAMFGPFHSVSLAYVYQFDRRLFIGESLSKRASSAADLEDSGGIQFKLRTSF